MQHIILTLLKQNSITAISILLNFSFAIICDRNDLPGTEFNDI